MTDSTKKNGSSDYIKALEDKILALENEINNNKHLEENKSKDLSYLNAILDQSLAGIYVIDCDGFFSYVNQVFADIFGYSSPDEIVGQFKIQNLVAPECHELVLSNVKKRASGEVKELRYTFSGLRKNGTRNTVEVHGRSMSVGSVRSVIGLIIDITDYQRMSELAFYDSLTNLPNRALFYDRLNQMISHVNRNKDHFTVLFIDLDGFKRINDNYGHAAGDHVLRKSAQRLQRHFRSSDTVCRFGGDEFVVILAGVSDHRLIEHTLINLLETLQCPITFEDEVLTVGASVGVSLYPTHGTSVEKLLLNADQAMYKAKEKGKHTYVFA